MTYAIAQIESPYLSIKEAATYLKLSVSTLYKLVEKRMINHRTHGNRLRFTASDLDAWSKSNERNTDAERKSREIEKSQENVKFAALVKSRKRSLKTEDQKPEKT